MAEEHVHERPPFPRLSLSPLESDPNAFPNSASEDPSTPTFDMDIGADDPNLPLTLGFNIRPPQPKQGTINTTNISLQRTRAVHLNSTNTQPSSRATLLEPSPTTRAPTKAHIRLERSLCTTR